METAIQVVWWVGLVGALVLTAIALKQVALVLRALSGIRRLAEITREAARGVAANTASVPALAPLGDAAGRLREAAGRQAAAAAAVGRKLKAVGGE